MAYSTLLRRRSIVLLLSCGLTACSAASLVPPAPIDGGQVSAIRPVSAAHMQPMAMRDAGMVNEIGYASGSAPVARTNGTLGYLDTPNLATSPAMEPQPQMQAAAPRRSSGLPMIDSDEALALNGGQTQAMPAPVQTGANGLVVTSEGINIDNAVGVGGRGAPAQPLGTLQIAEGATSEPVVDGIGTDSPQLLNSQVSIAPQPAGGERQVAMLSRPQNPMMLGAPAEPQFGPMPASELQCRRELDRLGVQYHEVDPISKGGSCGIAHPIKLEGLGGGIDVTPDTTLNCQMALTLTKWVRNEVVPAARTRYLSGVKKIVSMGGYSCRKMNNRSSNPWSEHAHGNAIDIGSIVLNNGKEIDVSKKGFFAFREKGLLKAVRTDSCKYFNTVLGPGSDPNHKDHFHLDLRARKSGYRHCG
jgi:hypothetical protein